MELIHSFLLRAEIPVVYAFLLRFPILCLALLVGFRWIALRLKPDLLANLFDVDGPGTVWVTLTALLCSWTIFLTGWTIYSHGPRRFGIGNWPSLGAPPVGGYALAAILGLICVSGVFAYSPGQNPSRRPRGLWFGCVGGLAIGVGLLAGMHALGDALAHFRFPTGLAEWLSQVPGNHGYVDKQGHLFPEHLAALALFLLSLLVYGVLGRFKRKRRGRPSGIPTLVYVLLLLMLAAWVLPGMSFALDPYHVPVLITLIAWLVVVSRSPRTDHFFDTYSIPYACDPQNLPKHPDQCAPTPAEVLALPEDGKVVLVAASGGGIQAAAWTARVLTGLEAKNPGKFARAIRLISSVSGGSVGSMYFSSRYQPNGSLADLDEIVEDAGASSLEDVSWGLAYPDLLRVLFPALFWKLGGRGRALERAWMHTPKLQHLLAARLSEWFAGVRAGLRPANIFNATLAETGDRLLFSTTYMPVGTPATPPARWDFHEFYLDQQKAQTLDVAVVTAARMSATFPYVTPASRPDAGGPFTPQLHVVDGGYFDNYGMNTLLEWLDNGLADLQQGNSKRFEKLQVMIVEIHEAPDPHRLVPPQVRKKCSWFFQAYAPLVTLFSVRTAGQRSHNQVDLELMKCKWGSKIQHVLFEFGTPDPCDPVDSDALKKALLTGPAGSSTDAPTQLGAHQSQVQQDDEKLRQAADPPLSWHLTEKQMNIIESEWKEQSDRSQAKAVEGFLR